MIYKIHACMCFCQHVRPHTLSMITVSLSFFIPFFLSNCCYTLSICQNANIKCHKSFHLWDLISITNIFDSISIIQRYYLICSSKEIKIQFQIKTTYHFIQSVTICDCHRRKTETMFLINDNLRGEHFNSTRMSIIFFFDATNPPLECHLCDLFFLSRTSYSILMRSSVDL